MAFSAPRVAHAAELQWSGRTWQEKGKGNDVTCSLTVSPALWEGLQGEQTYCAQSRLAGYKRGQCAMPYVVNRGKVSN